MTDLPRWFEDFVPGMVTEFGDYVITESEIIDFARRYDPQPFHTDPEAAKHSNFGGLIASGWNTIGAMMRMMVDHYVPGNASLGSPGIDEIRWLQPVRPGDRLRVRVTVQEATRSRSKPDRGVVRSLNEVLNQRGEVVMTMRGMMLMRAQPPA
jgi:acyl dehydratase